VTKKSNLVKMFVIFLKRIYKPKKSDVELCSIASFFLIGHQSNGHVAMLFNSLTNFWASLKCKFILYMFFHGYDAICFERGDRPLSALGSLR
jgi:hypothetical protein